MKLILLFFAGICLSHVGMAQLQSTPVCPVFQVDVMEGNVNNQLSTKSTGGEIKKAFPCFDESVDEETSTACARVSYKDKGITFYTGRNYLEITENFKGKMNVPLMGADRKNLFQWLGYAKIKDANWDAFQMKYGVLVTYYNAAGKINKIQISTRTAETLKLCPNGL